MKVQFKKFNLKLAENGFSLIEVLVSMAIFALIIGGVVLFSVRSIEANTKSRAMQNSIDNARFTIESVNKKIRTSHGINNTTETTEELVYIIDNVDAFKYCYKFTAANTLAVASISPTNGAYSATTDCGDFAVGDFSDIVGDGTTTNISGSFFVKETDESADERGFVRTAITIEYNDVTLLPAERDKITIQSSVSVRDY
ncbi:MAG: type II secretion system protein [Patescibacteria group bacterium]|nr:type II secretion system protein [Patescibacteria group bacterium]